MSLKQSRMKTMTCPSELMPMHHNILALLKDKEMTSVEMCMELGCSSSTVRGYLSDLKKRGMVYIKYKMVTKAGNGLTYKWAAGQGETIKTTKSADTLPRERGGVPMQIVKTGKWSEVPFMKWWEAGEKYAA